MLCSHESCFRERQIILPVECTHESDTAYHPWCIHCGLIKNISEDRPKKIGYWMNVLSKLSYRFSISQCQKRLIAKELDSCKEFIDLYGITGSSQKEMFVKTIQKYCNLSKNNLNSFLC
ncbi:MAG: hypothetical protein NT038_10395 [Euryarchaeota archaeon]|nr:hypothetical protein [Euryarchaeota archaeon]